MSFTCTTHPERLPIISEDCTIFNRGDADIVLGADASTLYPYGSVLTPGSNIQMDLSKQRWIGACTGTQKYDILAGGRSSTPSSTEIATQLIDSGLSNDIGSSVAQEILDSNLSGAIANSLLLTGTRIIDAPTNTQWGPIDHFEYTFLGVAIQDLTDAQSVSISWKWEVLTALNLSSWGELTVDWWSDIYGGTSYGTDVYEIAGPNINTPGSTGASDTGIITMPVKAPGMSLSFRGKPDPGTPGRIRCSGSTLKSYRVTPRTQWSTVAAADRILGYATALAVAGGGGVSLATPFAPYDGQVELHTWCSATATENSHVRIGNGSDSWARRIGVVSPPMEDVLFYPIGGVGAWTSRQVSSATRRPLYVRFFNAEAAARDFAAWVTCTTTV